MMRDQQPPSNRAPSRQRAYEQAFRRGLLAALIILLVVKWFTGIAFAPAAAVAVLVFVAAFGIALRMTPRA